MLSKTVPAMKENNVKRMAAIGRPLLLGTVTAAAILALSACTNTFNRLEQAGLEPEFSDMKTEPTQVERPDRLNPMRFPSSFTADNKRTVAPNSLWRVGAKAFFQDQRANSVGDILTVEVTVADRVKMENNTELQRESVSSLPVPNVYGLENEILQRISDGADDTSPSNFLSVNSTQDNNGDGTIERRETIETQVAAMVTQVLPNGNLVIYGTQEIRVNYELRQLVVEGIIRPEDISSQNTIPANKIAEARINYGGRGQVMDIQQPRIGNQMIDILSPF